MRIHKAGDPEEAAPDLEERARAAIVAEALTWQRTPYHHTGRVKGGGVDCLTLIVCVAQAVGLIPDIQLPRYSREFNLHRSAETYLDGLLAHTREVDHPKPADIVLWKFGRCFSHAAIVIEWPTVIHAHFECGVVLEDAERASWLTHIGENRQEAGKLRPRKFFSYW